MKTWQKFGYVLLLVALLVIIILSWGSIASACFTFALIMAVLIPLLQRFLIDDRDNDFVDDQNG